MAVAAAVYVAAALVQELRPGRREIFPVTAYTLFTWVPNRTQDYSLRLTHVDGQPLGTAVWFEDGYRGYWDRDDAAVRMLIQKFGIATDADADDTAEAGRFRGLIVKRARLDRRSLRFELVRRRYDALARAHGDDPGEEVVIDTVATAAS